MREKMQRGWGSGLPETPCGRGSTLESTERIRAWMPGVALHYRISTVCDAGAGDLGWISRVVWDVIYQPFDLVPRHPDVVALDITNERMPSCDLILCRAVLNHLSPLEVAAALGMFRPVGRYLLATQFEERGPGWSDWTDYDLRAFGLGEPIDGCPDIPGTLALWKL